MARGRGHSITDYTMYKIYISLKEKKRTPEEEKIYQIIVREHGEDLEGSLWFYYRYNKDKAKVSFSGFNRRVKAGWDREIALTSQKIQKNDYNDNRQKGKTLEQIRKEEFESDIIAMLKNGLPLSKRQREYVVKNTDFAKKLKIGV